MLIPFKTPANLLICGETNSGKTHWLERLIKFSDRMFDPQPNGVVVMYKRYQPTYTKWEQTYTNVRCVEGLQREPLESGEFGQNILLVLDDLMSETVDDAYFCSVYTAGRHMGIAAVVSLWHQIFPAGKYQRTISLNQNAYVLMRSRR